MITKQPPLKAGWLTEVWLTAILAATLLAGCQSADMLKETALLPGGSTHELNTLVKVAGQLTDGDLHLLAAGYASHDFGGEWGPQWQDPGREEWYYTGLYRYDYQYYHPLYWHNEHFFLTMSVADFPTPGHRLSLSAANTQAVMSKLVSDHVFTRVELQVTGGAAFWENGQPVVQFTAVPQRAARIDVPASPAVLVEYTTRAATPWEVPGIYTTGTQIEATLRVDTAPQTFARIQASQDKLGIAPNMALAPKATRRE